MSYIGFQCWMYTFYRKSIIMFMSSRVKYVEINRCTLTNKRPNAVSVSSYDTNKNQHNIGPATKPFCWNQSWNGIFEWVSEALSHQWTTDTWLICITFHETAENNKDVNLPCSSFVDNSNNVLRGE